ncbi:hypothetical protein MKW92_033116 [Papaver armeniacum]|nr:hypothetical protein MKW92_033116 [Papaver armeniacum]
MLVHLALALRASMEEERAIKDAAARDAEEKGGGQVSSSRDTTMNENASIMFDGANTCDLMADFKGARTVDLMNMRWRQRHLLCVI